MISQPTSFQNELLQALDEHLRATLQDLRPDMPPTLYAMLAYHLGWENGGGGGKRIRPLLTLLACHGAGGDWRQALPAAASVELIHNFSLIHDDIQDHSETRRGRPTVWVRWGAAQAINAGDALFAVARLAAHGLREVGLAPERALQVLHTLDKACLALTAGQYYDLAFESEEDVSVEAYLRMIGGKTASLLQAAVAAGAQVAGAADEVCQAYGDFGHHLGMAFQVLDDILGIWGSPSVTGKPTGDDLRARKKSLPILLGLARSPTFARLWQAQARTQEDLEAMAQTLLTCGALEEAQQLAQEHTEAALAALERAAPRPPADEALATLTTRLLHRER